MCRKTDICTYSPISDGFANLPPAELLVMIVVPLIDLVTNGRELFFMGLEEPGFSHIVGDPEKGDRTKYQRDSTLNLVSVSEDIGDYLSTYDI